MLENLEKYQIILASKSPRRQQLLSDLGVEFKVISYDVEEVYPSDISVDEIPEYLAKLKAEPFRNEINDSTLVITSDTVVCIGDQVLGKPANRNEAVEMLQLLSGKVHQVSTGVCLYSKTKELSFSVSTNVWFKNLSNEEIEFYIENYRPYDKAGAYGIQEWIGFIAIEKIEGSYFNVMGLPVHQLYEALKNF